MDSTGGPRGLHDRAEIRRTWRIGIEGWGIAVTRREECHRARWIDGEPAGEDAPRRIRRPIAAALALGATILASTAGWAVWANAPRPSAELRAVIPQAAPAEKRKEAKPRRAAGRALAAAAPVRAPTEEQAIRAALARAFSTGEPQDWSAGDRQGLVVVGDARASEGGGRCRDVAVLSRDGGFTGQVDSSVACAARDGTIAQSRDFPTDP